MPRAEDALGQGTYSQLLPMPRAEGRGGRDRPRGGAARLRAGGRRAQVLRVDADPRKSPLVWAEFTPEENWPELQEWPLLSHNDMW